MSLPTPLSDAIPAEIVRVARAAFPKENVFMRMRDEPGLIYSNPQFAALFSHTAHVQAHRSLILETCSEIWKFSLQRDNDVEV